MDQQRSTQEKTLASAITSHPLCFHIPLWFDQKNPDDLPDDLPVMGRTAPGINPVWFHP